MWIARCGAFGERSTELISIGVSICYQVVAIFVNVLIGWTSKLYYIINVDCLMKRNMAVQVRIYRNN